MPLQTLWDSPILLPLARAAERVGLELELFGSVATRALLYDAAGIKIRSLFELVEHLSDIDIGHNGPASMTPALEAAIIQEIPSASWFRWSILDRERMAERLQLQKFNIDVPLRNVTLGTTPRGMTEQVDELVFRALRGEVDIFPNKNFGESPRAGFDSEASAGLLYIDAAIDVLDTQTRGKLPLVAPSDIRARELISEGVHRLSELSQSGHRIAMRRLWYRLASTAARIPPELFEAAVNFFDLNSLLDLQLKAGFPAYSFRKEGMPPIFISSYLNDNKFRTTLEGRPEDGFGNWSSSLNKTLASLQGASFGGDPSPIILGTGNEVIAAFKSIPLFPGKAQSAGSSRRPLRQDFLHISAPVRAVGRALMAEQLAAVVIGYDNDGPVLLPVFAVASIAAYPQFSVPDHRPPVAKKCTIRLNLAGHIDGIKEIDVYLIRGNVK